MSKKAPNDARRWLGEEMLRWAQWARHEENISVSPYPSLVGWLIGGAILTDDEAEEVNAALGYVKAKPVETTAGEPLALQEPDEPLL